MTLRTKVELRSDRVTVALADDFRWANDVLLDGGRRIGEGGRGREDQECVTRPDHTQLGSIRIATQQRACDVRARCRLTLALLDHYSATDGAMGRKKQLTGGTRGAGQRSGRQGVDRDGAAVRSGVAGARVDA